MRKFLKDKVWINQQVVRTIYLLYTIYTIYLSSHIEKQIVFSYQVGNLFYSLFAIPLLLPLYFLFKNIEKAEKLANEFSLDIIEIKKLVKEI